MVYGCSLACCRAVSFNDKKNTRTVHTQTIQTCNRHGDASIRTSLSLCIMTRSGTVADHRTRTLHETFSVPNAVCVAMRLRNAPDTHEMDHATLVQRMRVSMWCAPSWTSRFLQYTKGRGNDLTTPVPPAFPGLEAGDRWCICIARWIEAHEAGKAPLIVAESTHDAALSFISKDILLRYDAGVHANGRETDVYGHPHVSEQL